MNIYHVAAHLDPHTLKNFVLQCDRSLELRMEEVAKKIAAVPELRFLGLTGPTCAGKTTAAKKLTEVLKAQGHRVHIISIDDFYYDKAYLQKRADDDPNIEIDYDSEDTIDISLLAQKAKSLLACKETQMPRFDFQTGERMRGSVITPRKDDIFLLEGIQILYPKVHQILSSVPYQSIYICPTSAIQIGNRLFDPTELRRMRRLVRDYRYRASSPAFTLYLWQSVRQNEDKNIFPNSHVCHEVIDSTMPYEVGMLKPYLADILPLVHKEDPFWQTAQNILKKLEGINEIPSVYMAENSLYKEFI